MGYLKIKNKKDFVTNFLSPVSNLNDMAVLKILGNNIECIIASSDSTIVTHATFEIETDIEEETRLNIPDLKKLIRVLSIIPKEEITVKVNENNISYNENGYKFKYHLLDDGIIKLPNINVQKINSLEFNTAFKVRESNLDTVFKGSSFTTETSKLYIYSDGDKISAELGDRSRHNADNFNCILSDESTGASIGTPLALNFESFRLISFSNSREVEFKINQEMGVITCTLKKGNTSLIYVISALIN